jgi:hypothetical protein
MKYLVSMLSIMLFGASIYAQETQKEDAKDAKALVEGKRFEFVAESANPLRGRTIYLSPGYTFTVLTDSLISDLPYYGRAFQASMDPADAGIKFTSTKFDYEVKPRKKSGWDVNIKPNDGSRPKIFLSVSTSGTGTLRITSVDRESISYSGYIRTPRKK